MPALIHLDAHTGGHIRRVIHFYMGTGERDRPYCVLLVEGEVRGSKVDVLAPGFVVVSNAIG